MENHAGYSGGFRDCRKTGRVPAKATNLPLPRKQNVNHDCQVCQHANEVPGSRAQPDSGLPDCVFPAVTMTKPASDSNSSEVQGNKPYGISLYRTVGSVCGWQVSIRRRGCAVSRKFVAAHYGGMDQALQAAIVFRDEVNREFEPTTKQEFCATLRSTNTSGVPGVFLTKDGQWKAYRQFPDGSKKSRNFSIAKYGAEEAFQRAVEARRTLLQMTYGNALHHPEVRSDEMPTPNPVPEMVRKPFLEVSSENPYAPPPKITGVRVVHEKYVLKDGTVDITDYWIAEIMLAQSRPLV